MEQDLQLKFQNIIKAFLIKRPEVSELRITEGRHVFFHSLGEWKDHELDFEILDSEIDEYQKSIIIEKVSDGENEDSVRGKLMEINERLKTKGSFKYSHEMDEWPFRITWSIGRGKSTMRIRRLEKEVKRPEDLGIPEIAQRAIREYRGGGLIVFAAPPGSGKSTSIASLIQDLLYNECVNVVTLEDPVEYIYKPDSKMPPEQREIGFDLDSYESGIETAMTQTPQIMVIQEMTTNNIIRAMMLLLKKDVMVVTTLHGSDISSIFKNISDAFSLEERDSILYELSQKFRCFVSQRLVPRSNQSGRVAVYEVLTNTNEAQGFVAEGNIDRLHQVLGKEENLSFQRDFINKIEAGIIDYETALKFCPKSRVEFLKKDLGL